MEYSLDSSRTISTGLMSPPVEGEALRWYPFSKQGVHFFKQPEIVDITDEQRHWKLRHKVTFRPKTGEIELQFVVSSENWWVPILLEESVLFRFKFHAQLQSIFAALGRRGKSFAKSNFWRFLLSFLARLQAYIGESKGLDEEESQLDLLGWPECLCYFIRVLGAVQLDIQ